MNRIGALSARGRPTSARTVVLLAAVCLTCAVCGGPDVGPDGQPFFGDLPFSASTPPAGLDTAQRQMIDGAGNPGPVRVRLLTVRPAPNSHVVGTPAPFTNFQCSQTAPFSCFDFEVELCVDSFPNPTNAIALSNMTIVGTFSADGTTPILEGAPALLQPPDLVQPGTCRTWRSQGSAYSTAAAPRFFMLAANYGSSNFFSISNINQAACPTPEAIANANTGRPPACAFRSFYDLGYHF
jgi:hypothetical protein